MIKFKKIGLFLLGSIIIFGNNLLYVQGGLSTRDHKNTFWTQNEIRDSNPTVDDISISEVNPIGSGSKIMGDKSAGILHLPQPENYQTGLGYAIALIQIAVNWTLGMLAVVTLIYLLYNGFLILSAGTDNKNIEKGKKGLKTAGIAIAGIALSWLIISIILRLIKSLS